MNALDAAITSRFARTRGSVDDKSLQAVPIILKLIRDAVSGIVVVRMLRKGFPGSRTSLSHAIGKGLEFFKMVRIVGGRGGCLRGILPNGYVFHLAEE